MDIDVLHSVVLVPESVKSIVELWTMGVSGHKSFVRNGRQVREWEPGDLAGHPVRILAGSSAVWIAELYRTTAASSPSTYLYTVHALSESLS